MTVTFASWVYPAREVSYAVQHLICSDIARIRRDAHFRYCIQAISAVSSVSAYAPSGDFSGQVIHPVTSAQAPPVSEQP
ncbi:hypothetical protein CCHOA_04225 [Corynebacterium choanae]|uniref:Uncharacterized protein n=1 Tax=Corynebacterium choanae TaxID=1862358 RepID=A0A3G6JB44_9CORY|nr:hypothetical protein CCHOA_04225 [Corynebacterium choanae]